LKASIRVASSKKAARRAFRWTSSRELDNRTSRSNREKHLRVALFFREWEGFFHHHLELFLVFGDRSPDADKPSFPDPGGRPVRILPHDRLDASGAIRQGEAEPRALSERAKTSSTASPAFNSPAKRCLIKDLSSIGSARLETPRL